LKEYKRYKDLKVEIQIRSILQHAWAEIEHDLGYKGEVSIPDKYKRAFNRLSALLETADIEFDRLKSELLTYEEEVPELIKSEPESVDINKASLSSFIDTNETLLEIRKIVEQKVGGELSESSSLEVIINLLNYFKLYFIGDLEKVISENKERYRKFVELFINLDEFSNNSLKPMKSAPLLYFLHYLAGKSQNIEIALGYAQILLPAAGNLVQNFANQYIDLYADSIK